MWSFFFVKDKEKPEVNMLPEGEVRPILKTKKSKIPKDMETA